VFRAVRGDPLAAVARAAESGTGKLPESHSIYESEQQ